MSLNCAEIDLILEELRLEGSFLQAVVQPSFDTIAFHLYKGARGESTGAESPAVSVTLLVCLAPGVCRLHETRRAVPKSEKPLRFMEFCRSRLRGSRVVSVRQLDSNRIVEMILSRGDERFSMYIRLWSGAANIIVTDSAGVILDVFYRRPKRNEITGESWTPEPPQPKQQEDRVWVVRDLPGEGAFNHKIDRWYAEHAQTLSREALIEEARRRFDTRSVRIKTALVRLEKKREEFLHADRWRKQGDLLTANLWAIKPGMDTIEVADWETGGVVLIPLDPLLKPQDNAARYYEKYRKAVSGLANLEEDIASSRRTLESLASELASLESELNPLIIQKALRKQNRPRQQIEKKYPGLCFTVDGWTILVGRTAAENDELLRRHVKGFDLWLHTRDWPGGYVFIKNRPGKTFPLEIMIDAGTLALFYSKGRKAGSADLYYTRVKYLRRAKGAPRGTVLPSNEKNLSVRLDEQRLKRLEGCREEE